MHKIVGPTLYVCTIGDRYGGDAACDRECYCGDCRACWTHCSCRDTASEFLSRSCLEDCCCADGGPGSYEGPMRECLRHGDGGASEPRAATVAVITTVAVVAAVLLIEK